MIWIWHPVVKRPCYHERMAHTTLKWKMAKCTVTFYMVSVHRFFFRFHPQFLMPPAMQILLLLQNYTFCTCFSIFINKTKESMTTTTTKWMTTNTKRINAGRSLIYDDIKYFILSYNQSTYFAFELSFTHLIILTNNFPFVHFVRMTFFDCICMCRVLLGWFIIFIRVFHIQFKSFDVQCSSCIQFLCIHH